jgi:hypothetical protein
MPYTNEQLEALRNRYAEDPDYRARICANNRRSAARMPPPAGTPTIEHRSR